MKKLLFYFLLSFTVVGVSDVILAETSQQTETPTQDQIQPQPQTQEQTQTQDQTQSEPKKPRRYSVDAVFQFSYDMFSKFKKLTVTEDNKLSNEDKSLLSPSLGLLVSLVSPHLRFTTGLDITFYSISGSDQVYYEDDAETSFSFTLSETLSGISWVFAQIGYRIKLDTIEILPYIGINRQMVSSDVDWDDNPLDIAVYSMPIYAGTKVFWKKLFVGIEAGYNIHLETVYGLHDNSDEGRSEVNKKYITSIQRNSGFDPGLIGKVVLGLSI